MYSCELCPERYQTTNRNLFIKHGKDKHYLEYECKEVLADKKGIICGSRMVGNFGSVKKHYIERHTGKRSEQVRNIFNNPT